MFDWNPNDPDATKVHYDVSAWNIDQRAELSEALAEDDVVHVWEGDELVVPEEVEERTDALFARLEAVLGPFPVPLAADDPSVEFGLDEWPSTDRDTLTAAFVEGGIPHRWDGTTVFVDAQAEHVVDELLDSIESGTLVVAGTTAGEGGTGPPEEALSTLFSSADRLAKDADDQTGQVDLAEMLEAIDLGHPPYGVAAGTWSKIIDVGGRLVDLCDDEDADPSDVIGVAQELRSLVRQYV